ncbi:MAG: AAA family ATPase, partial [Actinomycetota bacterium]|nr:AAA family ATPase [Actinomycetota bacterium]
MGTDRGRLIGREFELRELVAGLDAARGGGGRFFLLVGDAGIGKTRLAEEVAETARSAGVAVRWGSCRGAGTAPYRPWVEIVRAALADDPSLPLSPSAAHLVRLVPEVAGRLPVAALRRPSELPGARLALFHALADLLAADAGTTGLVVVLDDLDAADEASLRVLQFVARRLAAWPALLIGTSRGGAPRDRLATLARPARRTLVGLDESGVGELLERVSPGTVTGDLARRVMHATDGNPLLVQEVACLVRGEASPVVPVPEDGRQLIRRRLASLSGELRELLVRGAVLGLEFDVDALAALAETSTERVVALLESAGGLRIVEPVGAGRWAFGHALHRDALYDELRPSARAARHRLAGQVIDRRRCADPALHVYELAHHFFEAARDGDGDAAVDACTKAGDRAVACLAFEEAAACYGRALEAAALTTGVDQRRRHALLVALARSKERGGDVGQACETWRQALKCARATGVPELLAETAIGYTAAASSTSGDTRSVLEEARAVLPPVDGPLLARLSVRLGTEVAVRSWRLGRDLADQGLEMARRLGEPEAGWTVRSEWLAGAAGCPDLGEQELVVARELLALAERAGDAERTVVARQRVAGALFATGDVAGAAGQLVVAAAAAEQLG